MTFLFLYMVPGTGHQRAAQALIKATKKTSPKTKCTDIALGQHAYPILGSALNKMYLGMLKRFPQFWDFLYDNPKIERLTRNVRPFLADLNSRKVQNTLKKTKPSIAICTQAVAATVLSNEKKKGRLSIPIVGVITDFAVHSYWFHPEIDLYLVAHQSIKKKMMSKGIRKERIQVTGIPIDPEFGEGKRKGKRKRVVVMGGGRGLGELEKLAPSLKKTGFINRRHSYLWKEPKFVEKDEKIIEWHGKC